jgi:hypothetical protein
MHSVIPPPPVRLHGVVLSLSTGRVAKAMYAHSKLYANISIRSISRGDGV